MHDRVEFISRKAAALPPQRRADFLDGACAGDDALRAAVERQVAQFSAADASAEPAHADAAGADATETLIELPAQGATAGGARRERAEAATDSAAVGEQSGDMIGRYHLLQRIGEGGFGSVFMAEQKEPVRRKVALKIIKLGMDTRQVIARFEAERQALAMMDHPNIARVLDAGATATGRPYFVMELVRGVPLTEYCDTNSLTVRERIGLLIAVCAAVQHAHQKGIIHRDLKPSNVLVTLHDGIPMPKVIDFGIAKATSTDLTDKTVFTEYRQFIGTPEYMSPEQAAMSALDVDTRTDVYALGVLLYELITGSTPLDRRALEGRTLAEVQRLVSESPAPRPSTRLSTDGQALVDVARRRRIEPGRLRALVSGELDWIALKAMEKDRTRRYDTARELADDLRRYLDGRPVVAAPPSRIYRTRTFIRRNRAAVGVGALIALVLVIAVIGTSLGYLRARQAERVAVEAAAGEARQRQAAQASETRAIEALALAEHETARAIRAEQEAARRAIELERMIEAQAAMIRSVDVAGVGDEMRADVLGEIRESMLRAGIEEIEMERRLSEAEEVLALANFTNPAIGVIGRTILGGAERQIAARFADEPLLAAELLASVAETRSVLGFGDEAARIARRVIDLRTEVLGADHEQTIATEGLLAWMLLNKGDWLNAFATFRDAHRRAGESLGQEHPLTRVLGYMAEDQSMDAIFRHQRADEATWWAATSPGLSVADAQLAMREVPRLFDILDRYGISGVMRPADIEPAAAAQVMDAFEEVFEALRDALGETSIMLVGFKSTAGRNARALGLPARAEPYLREAMEAQRRMLGDAHPSTIITQLELAQALMDLDRAPEAAALLIEGEGVAARARGEDDPFLAQIRDVLVRALLRAERWPQAQAAIGQAIERQRALVGHDPVALAAAIAPRAMSLLEAQSPEPALLAGALLDEVLALRAEAIPDSWLTSSARSLVGAARLARVHTDPSLDAAASEALLAEAEAALLAGYAGLMAADVAEAPESIPLRRQEAAERLTRLFEMRHARDPEAGHDVEAARWRDRTAALEAETRAEP